MYIMHGRSRDTSPTWPAKPPPPPPWRPELLSLAEICCHWQRCLWVWAIVGLSGWVGIGSQAVVELVGLEQPPVGSPSTRRRGSIPHRSLGAWAIGCRSFWPRNGWVSAAPSWLQGLLATGGCPWRLLR